jgi:hypothetical protein
MGPSASWVDLDDREIRVRMGWAFDGRVPRSLVSKASRAPDWPWAIGVHGNLKGRWLVNGATTGIAAIDVRSPVPCRVAGFVVRVRRLGVSMEDPDGFLAALESR